MGSPRLAWVGAFVIGGLLLFAVGLFMIGDRRLLFAERFEIEADFGNVTGIAIGTGVRLAGFDAGEVLGIEIPLNPGERFLVRMRVREDLRPLVRTDSVAAVLTDGLLGSVFIQIRSGSAGAPSVEDGDRIRGVDAVEIADLIEEGRRTFTTVAGEFTGLREEMAEALGNLGTTVETTTQLVTRVGADIEAITGASARVMEGALTVLAETQALVAGLSEGEGTVGRLLEDDALYDGLVGTVTETEATVRAVRQSAEQLERVVARLGGPEGDATRLMADAGEAAALARNAMADIAENTEALKRSWPFSGFFADRGFYNLDQLTRDEYRELLGDDRYTPLRIWVEGDLLFETDGGGAIALAESAVARLDEAMAGLLAYPRDSPIVVEGYADGGGAGLEYRQSQARADLVRSHLARAYRRAASLTGSMPMGSAAEGSPSRDGRWDGVALTMFVDTERLGGEVPASAVTQ